MVASNHLIGDANVQACGGNSVRFSVAGSPRLTFRSLWSLGYWGLQAGMALQYGEQRSHKEHRREIQTACVFRITEAISSGVEVLSFSALWAMSSRRSPRLLGLALPHLP